MDSFNSSEASSLENSEIINSTNNEDLEVDSVLSETDDEESGSEVEQTNSLINSQAETSESRETSLSSDESEKDSEDELVVIKRKAKGNRILDDSESDKESSDEEEKQRKSFYHQYPDGDTTNIVEDKIYSKAIRRSMFGHQPKLPDISNDSINDDISDDSDSDVIICETESESENDKFDNSGMIEKKMSSTITSPLKENSFNVKEEKQSLVLNQSAANESKRVSKTFYDEQVADLESLNTKLKSCKTLLSCGNLPDGGEKLQIAIAKIENNIIEKNKLIKTLIVDDNESIKNQIYDSFKSDNDKSYTPSNDGEDSSKDLFMVAEDVQPKYTGKVGMKNFQQQKALTVEKLQEIHTSLDQRPADDVLSDPPKYLKVDLMKHQLHALAFMIWRETQKPRGGILADDMGLGKTFTTISLIMKQLQIAEEQEEDSDEDETENEEEQEWIARGHKALKNGGTLIVCPASLINQWEQEFKAKLKKNALDINVFHGAKRIYKARELIKYDVVITTYQIILSEHKNNGCLFDVKWDRIVLDEGHVIRNFRSKQSEAVCSLFAKKRWVLTGTPIQNKEFDIYAAIKFVRCSPFDDIRYWKMWIETRQGCSPRLQALLKSILLRRTKQQLQDSGDINQLPKKEYEQINVGLNVYERGVYNRMMALSQAIFAQFLAQQQEKHNNYVYDQNRLKNLHQRFAKAMNVQEVKAHEILTLLLRLRQICCHPGLVKKAIEHNEMNNEEFDQQSDSLNHSAEDCEIDILKKLQNLKLDGNNDDDGNANVVITSDNEVFNLNIPSTKIDKLMDTIREKIVDSDDKAIIVSQWVSHLDIIRGMLEVDGIDYCELNGKVPVKFRNDIVVEFNRPQSSKKIMLLSITAGGVGLNLVGANHLFIMDPHWNPQIEQQAQDRIYRFGQSKDVKIYKFICEDTIEEKILLKQQEKLDLATSTLTGAKRSATKLTIEDLKDLFGMK